MCYNGVIMEVIKQPNNWSCYACVAAMATGKTLQDVIDFVGYDGSEIQETSNHPDKRRGFDFVDINRFMAHYGFSFGVMGCTIDKIVEIEDYISLTVTIPMDLLPAMVLVESTMPDFDGNHCLYWDTKNLYDPYFDKPVDFGNYKLKEWWPVGRL